MKVIIAGGRNCNQPSIVESAVEESGFRITQVISGKARGADRLGELWADKHGVAVVPFPAEWEQYGKAAGYRRNAEMADYADALIALWDGVSIGTKHMIDIVTKKGLHVYVKKY